jgi:CGNR zinc finger/Putative stress-induced transcription regulator
MMGSPRYEIPRAAPEPLRLVQLFVNTTDHEGSRELLGSPSQVRRWLGEHMRDPGRVGPVGAERARALRAALHDLIRVGSPESRAQVEEIARRARLTVALEPPRLAAQAPGLDGVLGALLAIAYEAMRDGSWTRLKACRNCGYLFWDGSRNRSAAWCSMQLCGNRVKVRRHRRRRATGD